MKCRFALILGALSIVAGLALPAPAHAGTWTAGVRFLTPTPNFFGYGPPVPVGVTINYTPGTGQPTSGTINFTVEVFFGPNDATAKSDTPNGCRNRPNTPSLGTVNGTATYTAGVAATQVTVNLPATVPARPAAGDYSLYALLTFVDPEDSSIQTLSTGCAWDDLSDAPTTTTIAPTTTIAATTTIEATTTIASATPVTPPLRSLPETGSSSKTVPLVTAIGALGLGCLLLVIARRRVTPV